MRCWEVRNGRGHDLFCGGTVLGYYVIEAHASMHASYATSWHDHVGPSLTVEHPMPIQCQLKCERPHRKKDTILSLQVLPSVTRTDAEIVATELFVSDASTTSTLASSYGSPRRNESPSSASQASHDGSLKRVSHGPWSFFHQECVTYSR